MSSNTNSLTIVEEKFLSNQKLRSSYHHYTTLINK